MILIKFILVIVAVILGGIGLHKVQKAPKKWYVTASGAFMALLASTVLLFSSNDSSSRLSGNKGATCESQDEHYNPYIMNAACGSLSAQNCCTIKNWWNHKHNLDKASGRNGFSFGLYNSVGQVDSNGQDIIVREFKDDCMTLNWNAADCKTKVSTLLTLFKQNQDAEFQNKQKNEQQAKQQAEEQEKERQKRLGY